MSKLLEDIGALFSFLFDQLSNVANFFTSNLIGQIMLGVALFALIFNIGVSFFNKLR